jgi:hypothetical protein
MDRMNEFLKYQGSIYSSYTIKHRRDFNKIIFVGFEVLTVMVMKSSVFWDKTPCRV